jgi:hypothetical protein
MKHEITYDFPKQEGRRPCVNGDEHDAFGPGKEFYGWKVGERRSIKRRANRRARHEIRQQLQQLT